MSKHTPGRLAVHHHESTDTYTIHVEGRSWESWAIAHVGDCTQDEANARRFAACWNACEGMEDPEAEIAELRRLQAENELLHKRCQQAYEVGRQSKQDDLEELLRQALEEIEHHGGHLPWTAFVELRHDIRQHLGDTE